jgi:hypothetical protein
MKNNELELKALENADNDTLKRLSEEYPPMTEAEQNKLFERTEKLLAKTDNTDRGFSEDADSVSGVEIYHRPVWRKFLTVAAALLIVAGVGTGGFLMAKNFRNAPESQLAAATETSAAKSTEKAYLQTTTKGFAVETTTVPATKAAVYVPKDGLSIQPEDKDTVIAFCDQMCHKHIATHYGTEGAGFGDAAEYKALSDYLEYRTAKDVIGVWEYGEAHYEPTSFSIENGKAFVRGAYKNSSGAYGEYIFIVSVRDGQLALNDLIFNCQGSSDVKYRLDMIQNPTADFWSSEDNYSAMFDSIGLYKEITTKEDDIQTTTAAVTTGIITDTYIRTTPPVTTNIITTSIPATTDTNIIFPPNSDDLYVSVIASFRIAQGDNNPLRTTKLEAVELIQMVNSMKLVPIDKPASDDPVYDLCGGGYVLTLMDGTSYEFRGCNYVIMDGQWYYDQNETADLIDARIGYIIFAHEGEPRSIN